MWDANVPDRPYFLDVGFVSIDGNDRVSVDAEIACHEALPPGKGVIVYVSSETSDVNYLGFLTWVCVCFLLLSTFLSCLLPFLLFIL